MYLILNKKIILFIVIIGFFFVPYLGHYKLFKLVYGIYFVTLFLLFLGYISKISLNTLEKSIIGLYILESFWILTSIFINQTFFSLPFSFTDLGEISRPWLNIFIFSGGLYLLKGEDINSRLVKNIFKAIILVSLFNLFLCTVPKFSLPMFENIVEVYGEGKVYTMGYAKYRAFGIVGQPGKNAAFSSLLILLLLFFLDKGYKKNIIYISILANFVAILLTVSRTGLIFMFMILFLYLTLKINFKIVFGFIFGMLLMFFFIDAFSEYYDIELLFRGLDSGGVSTLDKRLYTKKWAFDTISGSFTQLIFGVGPSKEYLGGLKTDFADDLTLIAPDSSYTLWMLRYGLGGVLLFSMPFMVLLINFIKKIRKKYVLYILLATVFVIAHIDPVFHEPKIQTLIWIIIVLTITDNGQKTFNNRLFADRKY